MPVTVNYQMSLKELACGQRQIIRKRARLLMVLVPFFALFGALDVAAGLVTLGIPALRLAAFYTFMLIAGPRMTASKYAPRLCLPTEATFTTEEYATAPSSTRPRPAGRCWRRPRRPESSSSCTPPSGGRLSCPSGLSGVA